MDPIFIGGCDRSGTTLLGSLLGGHSECLTVPEAQWIIKALRYYLQNQDTASYNSILNKVKANSRFKLWNINLETQDFESDSYNNILVAIIKNAVLEYGKKVEKKKPQYWVDHTPWNIRFAPTLFDLFPQAKMIHLVRDGRAVAASIMPLDWGPNVIQEAAPWWSMKVGWGLMAEDHLGPERVLRVYYEDILAKPEETLETICRFAGITFQSEMLKGTGFSPPNYSKSIHRLVGKPPDTSRSRAWEKELTYRQIEIFESIAANFLICMNYKPLIGIVAKPIEQKEKKRGALYDLYRKRILNRLILRKRI